MYSKLKLISFDLLLCEKSGQNINKNINKSIVQSFIEFTF